MDNWQRQPRPDANRTADANPDGDRAAYDDRAYDDRAATEPEYRAAPPRGDRYAPASAAEDPWDDRAQPQRRRPDRRPPGDDYNRPASAQYAGSRGYYDEEEWGDEDEMW